MRTASRTSGNAQENFLSGVCVLRQRWTDTGLQNKVASVNVLLNPSKIEYGHRGEDIFYSLQDGRSILLQFTWANGARIYPHSIKKWGGINEDITPEEKIQILKDLIAFVNRGQEKPIVNINSDDSDKELWESVCKSESSSIKCVEYTSNKKQAEFKRGMFLSVLKAGKGLVINGRTIKDEKDLDDYLKEKTSTKTK